MLAAVGGGEGEEVGGLGAAGQIKGVNTFSAFRFPLSAWSEADLLAAAHYIGEPRGGNPVFNFQLSMFNFNLHTLPERIFLTEPIAGFYDKER